MAEWLGRAGGWSAADVRVWLEALPAETTVGGSGPRPGCLHLDRLRSGGHAGRPHLFVLGLDDVRFPGRGGQDPLLLDGERARLDPQMPTAASRLAESVLGLRRLLGRQRGQVTLSWPSFDVVGDAARFPSQAVLDAFREARGRAGAELEELLSEASPPASFAPDAPERALDMGGWRLWRFTGPQDVVNAAAVLARRAPDVARGTDAATRRASAAFTPFDGLVPLAGADLDPAAAAGTVLSSNGLETVGACPRRFFYHYALGLEPPEELVVDPEVWLDPLASGSLLHQVFEDFVRGRIAAGCPPLDGRSEAALLGLLERTIEAYRRRYPIPSAAVFDRERRLLRRAVLTFLREEAHRESGTGARPAFVEATFGMPPGEHGTELDHAEAVPIALPDGRTIGARGRIDRIDRPAAAADGW
jgi:ATP-dependent helicase/nuclease subunit B